MGCQQTKSCLFSQHLSLGPLSWFFMPSIAFLMLPGPKTLLPLQGDIRASWHLVSDEQSSYISLWTPCRNHDRTQHDGDILHQHVCSSRGFTVLPEVSCPPLMRTQQQNEDNPSIPGAAPSRSLPSQGLRGNMGKCPPKLKSTKTSPILVWWHTTVNQAPVGCGVRKIGSSKPALAT